MNIIVLGNMYKDVSCIPLDVVHDTDKPFYRKHAS